MIKSAKPRIGITLDAESPGGWSVSPWYALRANYADAVIKAGGIPLALPHHAGLAADMLDCVDGLLVTGGAFDVDPALYGAGTVHETVTLKDNRTKAELALVQGALTRNMPILGICGGEQLLAVALGGTLIQHIPDSIADALAHEQKHPHSEPGHTITIEPHSLLHKITGSLTMSVNTAHHQAVAAPGRGMINARAEDGVVEGIESPAHRFCLGVQWHPEYEVDAQDIAIFHAFIAASHP